MARTDWETRYYEAEALHTEANGMLTAERDRSQARFTDLQRETGELRTILHDVRAILKANNAIEGAQALVSYAEYQREALQKYGTHLYGCRVEPCGCGLDAALAKNPVTTGGPKAAEANTAPPYVCHETCTKSLTDAALNLLDGASEVQDNGLRYVCPRDLEALRTALNSRHQSCRNCGQPESAHTQDGRQRCLHPDGTLSDDCCFRPQVNRHSDRAVALEEAALVCDNLRAPIPMSEGIGLANRALRDAAAAIRALNSQSVAGKKS